MSEGRSLSRFQIRLVLLGLMTSLWVVAVGARLAYLTIAARDALRARGELQHQHTLKLDARRGTIRDRNGRELATSVEVESVYGVPKAVSAELVEQSAEAIAGCLGTSVERIASRLRGDKSFVWIERKARADAVRCLRSLDLRGIGFLPESRRFYPKRRLASQVLGYVGIDNQGMSGAEYALENKIRGVPGRRIIWTDARRRRAASRVEKRPVPGRSVFLTIDENLQYIAESELEAAVRETGSKSGIAILMRPRTGELLAMASYPSFNPNRYGDYPEAARRLRSVTDVYEPGSTFKIVPAAAALEEGVTIEDERIDCGRGGIRVANRTIRDHKVFDVLTFREVVENSSNVGMIRIGQRLGKERLERYIRAFGFGQDTGIELPAESRGILRPAKLWGPVTLASISFGQGISVTPLQMVAAANVIASSGYWMRPKLVLGEGAGDGEMERVASPEPVRRVVSEETARRLTELLVGVVERGTGRRAAVKGYRVAGKTGTAQKAVLGGYSKTDFIASFVGFAPAYRPALTALVILDSPEGDHSGSRAATVFARIVERGLRYLEIPPEDQPVLAIAKIWPQTRPILEAAAGGAGSVEEVSLFHQADRARQAVVPASDVVTAPERRRGSGAPNVLGLSARDALGRFVAMGTVPEIVGSGWVVEQRPSPGAPIEPGSRPRLFLGVDPAAPSESPESLPAPRERGSVRVAQAAAGVFVE